MDLKALFSPDPLNEGWARRWSGEVTGRLLRSRRQTDWLASIEALRSDLDVRLGRGDLNMNTAAHAWFALDLLQASAVDPDESCRFFVLGYVLQIGLTDAQWAEWGKVTDQLGAVNSSPGDEKLTFERLPVEIEVVLARRQRLDVLRDLYRLVRGRIRPLVQSCTRDSASYDEWLHSLARLIVALRERHFVPITDRTEPGLRIILGSDSGVTQFFGEEIWHPLAELLLTPDQLSEARRHEAVAAEHFAHVFTAIMGDMHLPGALEELTTAITAITEPAERFQAREELRLMRSRFQVPPYLFAELESYLRRP
ncbi:hypothetical protein [Streptomyces sp. NPDC055006]